MKSKNLYSTFAALTFLAGFSAAFSAPVVFNFSPSSPGSNVGPSESYTAGGATIMATGWLGAGVSGDLYQKYTAGQPWETGLGLAADGDHEIPPPYFVQLDVSDLVAKGFNWITFRFGSLQAGEKANVYADNTNGVLTGAPISTLTGLPVEQDFGVALTGSSLYFSFTGGGSRGADPILESATTSTVPDGGTTALLLGVSFIGLTLFRRRRIS